MSVGRRAPLVGPEPVKSSRRGRNGSPVAPPATEVDFIKRWEARAAELDRYGASVNGATLLAYRPCGRSGGSREPRAFPFRSSSVVWVLRSPSRAACERGQASFAPA